MDIKLLLVNSITALYLESHLKQKAGVSSVVRDLVNNLKLGDNPAEYGADKDVLRNLRDTVLWQLSDNSGEPMDLDSFVQRLRLNCQTDDVTFRALEKTIKLYPDEASVRKRLDATLKGIKQHQTRERLYDTLKKATYQVGFREGEINDWEAFVSQTVGTLKDLEFASIGTRDPAFVSSVCFGDLTSVQAAFENMEATLDTSGIIRFHLQALNSLLGVQGGGRRGEFGLLSALPHNNKSGTLLDMFIGTCLFNDPFLFEPDRKPLALFYSTEDDMPVIMQKLYVILKQIDTGLAVNVRGLDIDEASRYVKERLEARGWNVEIHRIVGSKMSYPKFIAHLEGYKAQGFEVVATFVDYLAMFNKEGCVQGAQGDDLQDLYKMIREYTSANRILFVTAHQLSTQAKEEKRQNQKFIWVLPGGGWYQGCKKLDTEVDWEFYVNKQIVGGVTYFEYLWGKHRGVVKPTPEKDKYFVVEALTDNKYGIPYDQGMDRPVHLRAVGGKKAVDGGGAGWMDLSPDDFAMAA